MMRVKKVFRQDDQHWDIKQANIISCHALWSNDKNERNLQALQEAVDAAKVYLSNKAATKKKSTPQQRQQFVETYQKIAEDELKKFEKLKREALGQLSPASAQQIQPIPEVKEIKETVSVNPAPDLPPEAPQQSLLAESDQASYDERPIPAATPEEAPAAQPVPEVAPVSAANQPAMVVEAKDEARAVPTAPRLSVSGENVTLPASKVNAESQSTAEAVAPDSKEEPLPEQPAPQPSPTRKPSVNAATPVKSGWSLFACCCRKKKPTAQVPAVQDQPARKPSYGSMS